MESKWATPPYLLPHIRQAYDEHAYKRLHNDPDVLTLTRRGVGNDPHYFTGGFVAQYFGCGPGRGTF